jgi:hypothetical protein
VSEIRKGVWLLAGTPVGEPYPCRCSERRFGRCSAVFCPCSGRMDPPSPACCAVENTPEKAAQAGAAYRQWKEMQRAGEG